MSSENFLARGERPPNPIETKTRVAAKTQWKRILGGWTPVGDGSSGTGAPFPPAAAAPWRTSMATGFF